MPDTHPSTLSAHADDRLTHLIRLKRLERPDADFWQRFEQEFRSRQLSSLVAVQPWRRRLRRACFLAARKAAAPATAVGAIAIAFFALTQSSELPREEAAAVQTTPGPVDEPKASGAERPLFVVDDAGNALGRSSELEELLRQSEAAIYQVNVLAQPTAPSNGYRLLATPVTYSHQESRNGARNAIGAQVISAQTRP